MMNSSSHQTRTRFTLTGIAVGVLFPAISLAIVLVFEVDVFVLLAIIGLAVPILGTVGWMIGEREDRLLSLADELEIRIEERTSAIRTMLDVTGDGFLTFGADYLVQPEYSNPCNEIFGGEIAGKRLPDLLYLDDQSKQDFVDGLDLYFSGKAKAAVIFDLLDKRVEVRDRIIEVDYRAIDEATIMCALTDVTRQERLEAEVAEQERRRDLILKAVSNRQYFAGFLEEANDLFQELDTISTQRSSLIPEEATEKLSAQLHTFKGNASFLGFTRTATVAHDFEDRLVMLPILENDLDLSAEVFVLKRQYYEEYNAISETLGEQWINELSTISVPVKTVRKVEAYVKSRYADDRALVKAIEQFRSVRMADLFSRFPQLIRDVAARRGRKVKDVGLAGGEFRVLPEDYEPLANALTHIARNMVDHGIESPAGREMKGKAPDGEIKIDIARDASGITIVFSDDGQGISFAAVESRARAKGLIDEGQKPTRSELLALLFSSGFSTAETVDPTSGRGVGLNAVQRAVRALGGKIVVETKPDRGTTFRITVPERRAR